MGEGKGPRGRFCPREHPGMGIASLAGGGASIERPRGGSSRKTARFVCRAAGGISGLFMRAVHATAAARSPTYYYNMARYSGSRWDAPAAQGQGMALSRHTTAWELRWWILAAVATSVAVNGGLLFWMGKYRLRSEEAAAIEMRTGVFDMEQEVISIPQEVLQPVADTAPDLTREVNNEPPVQDLPTIDQLAEALKDKAVTLTPTIQDMATNVTLSKPAPGLAGDVVDDLSKMKSALDVDVDDTLLSKKTTLQPVAMKPADDQMLIDPSALTSGAGDVKDDILRAAKKGQGGNNGLDGFKSLDDLVNYQGPITGDFKTMLRTDLLFDFGSAQLRSDARISLMKLGMIIQTNNKAEFRLVGHTDTIGDEPSNQKLSEARAQAVKDWLVKSLQLDGTRIIVEGKGEREPMPGVPRQGDAAAQQLNRRVEIHKSGG